MVYYYLQGLNGAEDCTVQYTGRAINESRAFPCRQYGAVLNPLAECYPWILRVHVDKSNHRSVAKV